MHRVLPGRLAALAAGLVLILLSAACGSSSGAAESAAATPPPPVEVSAAAAVEQPIARFIRATGTLMAEEQADIAAETAGRVVAAPVERGTPVGSGAELVRLATSETEAQLAEAEANAAQIEARLGLSAGDSLNLDAVPEVQNARAASDLTSNEFSRVQVLLDQHVVSQSEFDQRKTQMEAARQQYQVARNAASQQYQALQAARARVALARKALADTVVRAPFGGVVAERLVSVGDYVNKGTKVAVIVRVNPLRVQLTVPEQFVPAVAVGQTVIFEADAYPGRRFEGTVRYVSPVLEANQRALTVEAVVPNPGSTLKPGLFVTGRVEQSTRTQGVLVPASAVQTSAGTSRVYVVKGDHVEERVVTVGETVDAMIEITSGVNAGEQVATTNVAQLVDGARVS
jgi:membrane fusion protein (multidrug efflux system)